MIVQKVAVSGIGCLCGPGLNLDECMDSMFRGKRNPAPPRGFTSFRGTEYPVFEINQDIPYEPLNIKTDILRTGKLAISAVKEALQDAGLDRKALKGIRAGVCIGTTVGSSMNNEDFYIDYRNGGHPPMAPIERFLNSNPAKCISREYDIHGPIQTILNACSSGADAIGTGASWIHSGICDLVIAGGADELSNVPYKGFISLMITDDSPCRPFDKNRKGLNLGEGAAVMILESEAHLEKREKKARAFVHGYGSACDAYHLTAPSPTGDGLKRAIAQALAKSGIDSTSTLAFINAHGTGTLNNDLVESRVLSEVAPGIPFFSTKGYTGHTLGAAGAIEAAFTVAFMEKGKIPANAGFENEDPDFPDHPVKKVTQVKGSFALSQSLAFGGNNAVLVFGRENSL